MNFALILIISLRVYFHVNPTRGMLNITKLPLLCLFTSLITRNDMLAEKR